MFLKLPVTTVKTMTPLSYAVGPSRLSWFGKVDMPEGVRIAKPADAQILITLRQNENDVRYLHNDTFSVRVICVENDGFYVKISRIDHNGGWGMRLRMDILVIH